MRKAVLGLVILIVLAMPMAVFGTPESEQVTLNVLLYGAGPAWEPVWEAYASAYPDVTLEYEFVGDGSILRARTAAGDYPDAWMSEAIDDLVRYEDVLYDFSNAEWIDDVIPWTLESSTINGKILGVPNSIQGYGIIYNLDLFEQAGITALPTTLDELEAVCEQLVAAGIPPFETGFAAGWPIHQMYSTFLEYALPGNDVYKLTNGELTFADLEVNDNYFRFIDLLAEYSNGDPLESAFADQAVNVATGKVAMTHQGDWVWGQMTAANPEPNVGFFPTPVSNNAADAKLAINPANRWAVYNDGVNVDAASDLIGFFVVDPIGVAQTGIHFVVPSVNAPEPNGVLKQDVLRLALAGMGSPWSYQKWPSGSHDFVVRLTQEYLLGSATPNDFAAQLQAAWDDLSN